MANTSGVLLREWRTRRRFSQLDLALRADVSAKHLSYVETGRSHPSREMILHLCESLDIPLRDRNDILLAAGFAPRYRHTPFDPSADNELRVAVDMIVNTQPFPTIVVDPSWDVVTFNSAAAIFLEGVAPHVLTPAINVMRISLHPEGLAPRIANFDDYADHAVTQLRRSYTNFPTPTLHGLLDEFGHLGSSKHDLSCPGILLPLILNTELGQLRMFSTITTFGTPLDVTLDELAVETFYPADPESRVLLGRFAESS